MILSRVTEKIIKRSPVTAPVNNSLPFLTCSALSPPVMIWIVAASMITSEIAPAVPARKVRRASVKPLVLTGIHPSAVSIAWSPQVPVGSKARVILGETREARAKRKTASCVRIEVCFLSGKNFFIAVYWFYV